MPPAEINRERKRGWRWERKRTRARHADKLNRGATAETVAEFRASRFITLAESEDNLRPTKSRFALSALVLSCPRRDALYVCRLFYFLSLSSHRAFFPVFWDLNFWRSRLFYLTLRIYLIIIFVSSCFCEPFNYIKKEAIEFRFQLINHHFNFDFWKLINIA